jgi:hypothetical protein
VRTELEHPEGGSRSLSIARCEKRSVRRPEVRVGKALDPLLLEAFLPGDEPPEVLKDRAEVATDEEQATLVREAKDYLDNRCHPGGYNIGVNVGKIAGQTVMHLHVHMIPRYTGDVEDPRGGVRGVIPEKRRY